MSWVAILDAVELVAILTALLVLLRGWTKALRNDVKGVFLAILLYGIFHSLSNVLEWTGITASLDVIEDFLEVLLPVMWGILIYAFLQYIADKELTRSKDRFRNLVETTSDWVWETDRSGTYTYVSPKVKELLGYLPQEVIGKKPFDFMTLDEAKRTGKQFAAIVENQEPFAELENKNIHKDGSLVVIETSGVPIFDNDGHLVGYRGIDRDITDRKAAEKELRKREEKYRRLIEDANDAIFIADAETGIILEANGRAEKLLGMRAEEIIGMHQTMLHPTEDAEQYKEIFKTHVLAGKKVESGLFVHHKSGIRIPVEISTSVIDLEGGKVVQVMFRDLTARKRAEEELKKAKEDLERQNIELKKLDKMKDGLIRDVSHELKTPVAKHKMHMEMLKKIVRSHDTSAATENVIKVIESSIKRQEHVIRNILDLSRLEAGGRKYKTEPVNLDEVIMEVLEDFQHVIEASQIKVITDLESITVRSDREMLLHALSNLIGNAVKYASLVTESVIKIFNELREESVLITITDNGVGMTGEEIKKAFDPFYQATSSSEGSGVGLSISLIILESLGGSISLTSAGKGRGTTASVVLPL